MFFVSREGWIELICGSMFSGKTEELIRRIKRARIARQNVQVVKPALDDRYRHSAVVSHTGVQADCIPLKAARDILDCVEPDTDIVAVDEVQFFDAEIVDVCSHLADQGMRVICAGLDTDFRGEPFGPTPLLMATAEYVTKLQAICVKCGQPANRTQRMIDGKPAYREDPVILVGADERYEARCRHCHEVPSRQLSSSNVS